MSRNATSQAQNLRALAEGWSPDAALRLKMAVKATGRTHEEVAGDVPISRQRLSGIIGGKIHPSQVALERIAEVIGITAKRIVTGEDADDLPSAPPQREIIFNLPALVATASAGNGNIVYENQLQQSPFFMTEEWARSKFGAVTSLRVVLVKGASQEPDLCDGDWVVIDETKCSLDDGLAVVRLDDSLLIKRLQREGHTLHLLSKNPEYLATTLDLRRDEERFNVIGKVVYSFRGI